MCQANCSSAWRPRRTPQYYELAVTLSQASGYIHSITLSTYVAEKVYREEGRYAHAKRCETQAMNAMRQVSELALSIMLMIK